MQIKHEKARRQALGSADSMSFPPPYANGADKPPSPPSGGGGGGGTTSPTPGPGIGPVPTQTRRKVTGGDGPLRPPSRTGGVLSPLNPRARGGSALANSLAGGAGQQQPPGSPTGQTQLQTKVRRTFSLSRKT